MQVQLECPQKAAGVRNDKGESLHVKTGFNWLPKPFIWGSTKTGFNWPPMLKPDGGWCKNQPQNSSLPLRSRHDTSHIVAAPRRRAQDAAFFRKHQV